MRTGRPLDRNVAVVLASLALALVAATLVVRLPGLPPTLKADEPAYFLGALSFAEDFDFRCEPEDLERAFASYPWLSVHNLILASDDGWRTVHFGKPWLYPAIAAPFAALAGAPGMVAFNMALLGLGIWLGTLHLRRWNPDPLAALVATGIFLGSHVWAYAFWLHPEVLILTSIAVALHFGLDPAPDERRRATGRLVLSAVALAIATYHKPMLAAFGLPILVGLVRERAWRGAASWIAAATLAMGLFAGGSMVLTGHPTSYLGVARAGFNVQDPAVMPTEGLVAGSPAPTEIGETVPEEAGAGSEIEPAADPGAELPVDPDPAIEPEVVSPGDDVSTAGWSWLFRIPSFDLRELREDTADFLIGRHTGWVPYQPFGVLCFLLFLLDARRSARRWALVVAIASVAGFLLIFIPFNWHGGGGFVGNRYFVLVAPAFLYLVHRIRFPALVPATWAVAGLTVGFLWWSGYGVPVPRPTLQVHTRSAGAALFPLELSLKEVPGYDGVVFEEIWFRGRRDQVLLRDEGIWIRGGAPIELSLQSAKPIDELHFMISSPVEGNRVVVDLDGARRVLRVGATPRRIRLVPQKPSGTRWERNPDDLESLVEIFVRRLRIETATGEIPEWVGDRGPRFYLGARLRILGSGDGMSQSPASRREGAEPSRERTETE